MAFSLHRKENIHTFFFTTLQIIGEYEIIHVSLWIYSSNILLDWTVHELILLLLEILKTKNSSSSSFCEQYRITF